MILKKTLLNLLTACQVDGLLRKLNKNKLLTVMYHGITTKEYSPPIWTQLPETTFIEQLEFVRSHYNIISLSRLLRALSGEMPLPEKAALITFDDGLRNNYSVAFPALKRLSIPAAIFLTMDFIGTNRMFWFDEILFHIKDLTTNNKIDKIREITKIEVETSFVWDIYVVIVSAMKRLSDAERDDILRKFRKETEVNTMELEEDFSMLTWEQVREMDQSGVIEFGTHTANHQILTNMSETDWEAQLKIPRQQLSKKLGKDIRSFCYPNGTPGQDFEACHMAYLKDAGYQCAFSTQNALFSPGKDDPFSIGRLPAGNDFTSYLSYLRLSASGAFNINVR